MMTPQPPPAALTGDEMAPQTALDADLAHLGTPAPPQPVRPRRRRLPHEVPLLYHGRWQGFGHEDTITVIVPDADNAARVAQLARGVMPTLDQATGQMSTPLDAATLHTSGISYQFWRHETQLVDEEDVPWLLAHKAWEFTRLDQPQAPDDDPRRERRAP